MGKISLNSYIGGNVDPSNCSFVHKFEHIFLYYFIFVSVTQALEHYTDIFDIKRAIVHTHLLNPEVIPYPIFYGISFLMVLHFYLLSSLIVSER